MGKGTLKKYRVVMVGGVVIALAVGGFFGWKAYSTKAVVPSTIYKTETVQKGTLKAVMSGTGNLSVRDEVSVSPVVSGEVTSVKVEVGDVVEKGDTLFTLDDTDVESEISASSANVISAKESVARARASVTSAKSSLSKLEDQKETPVQGGQTVTSTDIKAAEQSVDAAQLGLSAASAKLSSAQQDYADAVDARSDLKVKASCAGTIWTVSVEKGDTVSSSSSSSGGSSSSSSSPQASGGSSSGASTSSTSSSSSSTSGSITIAKNSVLGVKLAINEADVMNIKEGQIVEVTFDALADETFTGQVDEVAHEGVSSSSVVTYDVWVTIDKIDARLKSSMTAAADIITSQEEGVLLVSNAAIKGSGASKYVLVQSSTGSTAPNTVASNTSRPRRPGADLAASQGTPTKVEVTTGTRGATQTVITSGLTAGQIIVTQEVSTSTTTAGAMDGGLPTPLAGAVRDGNGGGRGGGN